MKEKKNLANDKPQFKIDRGDNSTEKSLSNKWLDRPDGNSFSVFGKNKKFIPNGQNNDQPDYIESLLTKSAEHFSMVNGYIAYIIGQLWSLDKGEDFLKFFENDPTEEGTEKTDDLNEILKMVAHDLKVQGACYLQIIWSRDGESISKIEFPKSSI